jgi:hypothetical protein
MKFDQMCNIILGEAKQKDVKFEKLVIGNQNPTFTREDILRDPTDPSKGSKLYLASKEEKDKGIEVSGDQSIRRQLRRLNWIAKTIIKKFHNRAAAFSIDDMNNVITELLNRYQTKILGKKSPDKANTGYEVRVIGNLLLPPTKRNPNGKSVLMLPGMDPNATVEDAVKPIVQKKRDKLTNKVIKGDTVTANDLWSKFNELSDVLDELFDPDLETTIKEIIAQGKKAAEPTVSEPEPTVSEPEPTAAISGGDQPAPASGVQEAVEGEEEEVDQDIADIADTADQPEETPTTSLPNVDEAPISASGVTVGDILRDERIKNVFNPKAVKQMIKQMINTGAINRTQDGSLELVSGVGERSPLFKNFQAAMQKKSAEAAERFEKQKAALAEIEAEKDEEEAARASTSTEKNPNTDEDGEERIDWNEDENLEEPTSLKPKHKTEKEIEKEEEEEALKRYGFK